MHRGSRVTIAVTIVVTLLACETTGGAQAQRAVAPGFGRATGGGGGYGYGGGGGGRFGGGAALGLGLGLGLGAALLNGAGRPPPQQVYDPPADMPPPRPHKLRPPRTAAARSFRGPPTPPPPRAALASRARPGFVVLAADEKRYVADEVLVMTKGPFTPEQTRRLEVDFGLTPLGIARVELLDATVRRYRLRQGTTVPQAIAALRKAPGAVVAVQPNFVFALQGEAAAAVQPSGNAEAVAPSAAHERGDASRPPQYAIATLKLAAAHQMATGSGVIVAVIDTGIDETHPDLADRVADRFDAVGGRFVPHSHGTAMAGVIVAHTMLVGIAPDARLLAIRAFSGFSNGGANGLSYDILRGLDFAAAHGARIVNMSFAGPEDAFLRDALDVARRRGMVEIAAVGNAGPTAKPLHPAAQPGVIAVTATDANNKLFSMANRGRYVAFAAPGVNILAPGLDGALQLTSGTSIATAEASGIAALLLQGRTAIDAEAVRKRLSGTATPLPADAAATGAGLLDAEAAVSASR